MSIFIGIVVLRETLADPLWHKALAFAGLGVGLFTAMLITRYAEGTAEDLRPPAPSESPS